MHHSLKDNLPQNIKKHSYTPYSRKLEVTSSLRTMDTSLIYPSCPNWLKEQCAIKLPVCRNHWIGRKIPICIQGLTLHRNNFNQSQGWHPKSCRQSENMCLILPDLSAAFDTVSHPLLLNRLQHHFSIQGTILKWIENSAVTSDHTTLKQGYHGAVFLALYFSYCILVL